MGDLVVTQFHEAVVLHLQICIVAHLVNLLWKRLQLRFLHCVETLLTGIGTLLHACLVEHHVLLLHGLVQSQEAYDVTPSELGCDAVVGDAHGILHECFLRRLARITGQHCEAVVVAHVLQGFVQVWLMSVRCDDG